MSKIIPPSLQDHLDSGSTSMVYCWRVTRIDGTVEGFTEHDNDLSFEGTTFLASSGFTGTKINTELGLTVDNMNVEGALSATTINEDDLAAGRYDAAVVEIFWVNFNDPAQRVIILKGALGEVKRNAFSFSAELRSLAHKLQQTTGRTFTKEGYVPEGSPEIISTPGTIDTVQNSRVFIVTGLNPNSNGKYNLGRLTFTSGLNSGVSVRVKIHKVTGPTTTLTLWEKPPFQVENSDTFDIETRRVYSAAEYKAEFGDLVNFRGFPHIPGNDILQSYPVAGGADQDGGSRVKT